MTDSSGGVGNSNSGMRSATPAPVGVGHGPAGDAHERAAVHEAALHGGERRGRAEAEVNVRVHGRELEVTKECTLYLHLLPSFTGGRPRYSSAGPACEVHRRERAVVGALHAAVDDPDGEVLYEGISNRQDDVEGLLLVGLPRKAFGPRGGLPRKEIWRNLQDADAVPCRRRRGVTATRATTMYDGRSV